jgi:hypothetical protein
MIRKPSASERFSKEDFCKRTELAVELSRSLVPPLESRVIVLVDSALLLR